MFAPYKRISSRTALRFMFLAAVVVGCGDVPAAPVANNPVTDELKLVVWLGNGYTARCYSELPVPVTVRVRGNNDAPVFGQKVDFRVVEGDGWVREGTAVSDAQGFAADYWTLGAPGPQILEARTAGIDTTTELFARFTATAEASEVGLRRITNDPSRQVDPAISGDHIVFREFRNKLVTGWWVDIDFYDLATETKRRITTQSEILGNPNYSVPAISGDRIIWWDDRNGNYDIFLYDLATETERQITTDPIDQGGAVISGNRIVWPSGTDTSGTDFHVYDLETETERLIPTDAWWVLGLAISGDRIVYDDRRNGNQDIYLYDLTTDTERQITTDTSGQESPAISGDRIVWIDRRNGNENIYLYDLATETERRITTYPSNKYYPAISGDHIVWSDGRHEGKSEIYLYDLATQTERRLTPNSHELRWGTISGNRIVWADSWIGNWDIYMFDLTTACAPPAPPNAQGRGS